MDDIEYQKKRAQVIEARATLTEHEEAVLVEAVVRDEAYVLHAWYFHALVEFPFFTLDEAVARADGDCAPRVIVGPGGATFDPYTGEPGPGYGR